MKLTTITVLSNDADADSAHRIYQQGEPDAVWQAFQALMTNPDNVLTFGSAPTAEEQFQYAGWREQIESRNSEIATLRTQLEERNAQVVVMQEQLERCVAAIRQGGFSQGAGHIAFHAEQLLANAQAATEKWLANHDAQVLRDAARACRAGKCGDPRCDHITCGTLEVAADRILEVADARADRLSAPKPEQG